MDIKIKNKICEIYQLDTKLNDLEIETIKIDKEIAKLYINIKKIEISSEKLTNKKGELIQRKEVVMITSMETSIVVPAEGNVNDSQQNKIPLWKRGFQFF